MRKILCCLAVLVLIILASCSAKNPIVDEKNELATSTQAGYSAIAGSGTMILDPSGQIRIEPDRDAAFHFNVTSYLAGWCPGGCLKIKLLSIVGEIWTIEITIENPTALQVYDVRVIYYNLAGKTVMNPDGYIDLYGKPVSPFTAFAKEYANRAFPVGPGGKDKEILELKWPSGQPASVGYLIDVSVGGNCDEPWMIETNISNHLPSSGGLAVVISRVYDWQDDETSCICDWRSLGGTTSQMNFVGSGAGYRDFDFNMVTSTLAPGDYTIILCAKEFKPNELHLYDTAIATVDEQAVPVKISEPGQVAMLNFTSKTVGAYGDNVYVVWSENMGTSFRREIYLKEKQGENWLDQQLVSEPAGDTQTWDNPSIAVNANKGDLHFLWEGMANGNGAISYRSRKGTTWSTPQILFQGAFCMDSNIDVEDNSEIHIVFQDSDGPFLCLWWIHDPGTGTFGPPTVLAESMTPMDAYYAPAIDHDSAGYVHVPFMTGINGVNNVAYKKWNDVAWSGLFWLTTDNNSYYPDIAVAPNRKATLLYDKDDLDIYMKQWTGSWETGEHQVTLEAQVFGVPNCDSDSLGNIHLAFCGQSSGNEEIYYMVMNASSLQWTTPVNLSNTTSSSRYQSLIVGPDDKVHIVWMDNADGQYGVYYVAM